MSLLPDPADRAESQHQRPHLYRGLRHRRRERPSRRTGAAGQADRRDRERRRAPGCAASSARNLAPTGWTGGQGRPRVHPVRPGSQGRQRLGLWTARRTTWKQVCPVCLLQEMCAPNPPNGWRPPSAKGRWRSCWCTDTWPRPRERAMMGDSKDKTVCLTNCARCSCSRRCPTSSSRRSARTGTSKPLSRARSAPRVTPRRASTSLIEGELVMSRRSAGVDIQTNRTSQRGVYCGAWSAYIYEAMSALGAGESPVYEASVRVTKPSRFFVLDAGAFARFMQIGVSDGCAPARGPHGRWAAAASDHRPAGEAAGAWAPSPPA